MFAFLKALVLGFGLAFIVSLFIGSGGASAGMLNVHEVTLADFDFYWSWPLFVIGTGLSFGVFLLLE